MTKNNGIVFQDVPFNKESLLVTYTDASWSNAPYSTSQLGILAMMTTPTATRTQQHGSIIDWRSCRSPRVCRSTLAAAATAADEGADRAAYINMHISEILYRKPAHQVGGKLSYVQVTYAKSLYDCIIAPNPSLSDKRSLVNIRAIQEAVSPSQTRWVPTFLMFADGLTKISSQLRDSMSQWLQGPYVKLTEGFKQKWWRDKFPPALCDFHSRLSLQVYLTWPTRPNAPTGSLANLCVFAKWACRLIFAVACTASCFELGCVKNIYTFRYVPMFQCQINHQFPAVVLIDNKEPCW